MTRIAWALLAQSGGFDGQDPDGDDLAEDLAIVPGDLEYGPIEPELDRDTRPSGIPGDARILATASGYVVWSDETGVL